MHPKEMYHKAAIILASIPRDSAAAIMKRLEPDQRKMLSIELAQLGKIPADEQEAVLNDFLLSNPNALGGESGGLAVASALLESIGEDAATLDEVRQSVQQLPFGFLKKIDPQNILTFMIDEHPQTIALVLSHLPPSYGAQIIAGLPSDRQLSVIRRIAHMGQTNPEVIEEVQRGLEKRMANVMNESFENAGGVAAVAEMLNVTDRGTERALLENLSQEDPDLVEEIRRRMFVFEDCSKLSDKDIQAVLKNVESAQWALALKGASPELRQKILGNMSQRAAAMLTEEMEYLGPVRLSEVEKMQQQIVDIVRRLEDAGEITVGAGDESEEFIQ